jgi:hypothetical protein
MIKSISMEARAKAKYSLMTFIAHVSLRNSVELHT